MSELEEVNLDVRIKTKLVTYFVFYNQTTRLDTLTVEEFLRAETILAETPRRYYYYPYRIIIRFTTLSTYAKFQVNLDHYNSVKINLQDLFTVK